MAGGGNTLQSYCGFLPDLLDEDEWQRAVDYINDKYSAHLAILDDISLFYEDRNHIFVHAGINPEIMNWQEQSAHDFMYMKEPFISSMRFLDKVVVFGHTRVFDIHGSADIWFGDGKIGIDGGCAYGMQLNCLEIVEGQIYNTYQMKRFEK